MMLIRFLDRMRGTRTPAPSRLAPVAQIPLHQRDSHARCAQSMSYRPGRHGCAAPPSRDKPGEPYATHKGQGGGGTHQAAPSTEMAMASARPVYPNRYGLIPGVLSHLSKPGEPSVSISCTNSELYHMSQHAGASFESVRTPRKGNNVHCVAAFENKASMASGAPSTLMVAARGLYCAPPPRLPPCGSQAALLAPLEPASHPPRLNLLSETDSDPD